MAGTDGVSTKAAVTTIDGGAGTDYIYLFNTTGAAVDITTTMSDKLSQGTFSGFQANVQYGAGDVLNLATSVSVSGSNFTGAGASIYIISQGAGLLGASGVSTGQGIGGIQPTKPVVILTLSTATTSLKTTHLWLKVKT